MCSDEINEYILTIETKKPLETYEHIVGNSWVIFSMFAPFSSVIVVHSVDVVNRIFRIILMIFVKVFQGILWCIIIHGNGLNEIELPQWLLQDTHTGVWPNCIISSWNLWTNINHILGWYSNHQISIYNINW